ncbi:MAG: phenylalanine--tRNA ligase subunit alpha [Rickettsiales bacterium]|nr:phenylalanine--tRNA ligase subunit alpha [Rickettsiales bacterium]
MQTKSRAAARLFALPVVPAKRNEETMLENIKSLEELQKAYSEIFGKSGTMTARLKDMKNLGNDARAALNKENSELREAFRVRQEELENETVLAMLSEQRLDAAAPFDSKPQGGGKLHVMTQSFYEIAKIFEGMGYALRTGPEIEDDWHNFTALNAPEYHPARDMQDTFFVEGGNVMRTQTSAVQIRAMEKEGAPIKIIVPGTTYRKEMDATHFPMFHQVEGLVIGDGITISNLVADMKTFVKIYFDIAELPAMQIRPSYFPFTEPSIEMDVKWNKKTGRIGQGDDWLEIFPGGMVHPAVLRNVGLDPDKNQGFAFGFGWDRMVMLKYGLPDGRKFYDNDIRWLKAKGF